MNLVGAFRQLEDPRLDRNKRHQLVDVMVIAITAVICGAEQWTEIELFGRSKQAWFEGFLELPHGIPSHDTFGRVFSLINPDAFQRCFIEWVKSVNTLIGGQVVAVDGKTLRRSHDRSRDKKAIHMVSAWAADNELVLGQLKTDEKSNEITAIPELLQLLALKGCIVTIDAMGCQKEIAQTIQEQGADYVLALKGNQSTLMDDIQLYLDHAIAKGDTHLSYDERVDAGHGRIEVRRCWASESLEWLEQKPQWSGLRSVCVVESERIEGGKSSIERRYYISSLAAQASQLSVAIRQHWGIENKLHWVLDVVFREDENRVRVGHAPENMAVLRHMALNLLKQETSLKLGIKAKRLKAGWDSAYLVKILGVVNGG